MSTYGSIEMNSFLKYCVKNRADKFMQNKRSFSLAYLAIFITAFMFVQKKKPFMKKNFKIKLKKRNSNYISIYKYQLIGEINNKTYMKHYRTQNCLS